MLAIRITKPFSSLKWFCEKIKEHSDKSIYYEHTESARPHVHGLIVNPTISTDTMKNWLRKHLGPIPKTDWSFVAKDVNEKFITYMSKGKLEPSYVFGFSDGEVNTYRGSWEDRPRKQMQTKLSYVVKETPDERRMRQEDMVKEIVRRVQLSEDKSTDFIIGTIYRVVSVENRTMLGRYKMRDYYDAVTAKVDYQGWLVNMRKIIAFRDI